MLLSLCEIGMAAVSDQPCTEHPHTTGSPRQWVSIFSLLKPRTHLSHRYKQSCVYVCCHRIVEMCAYLSGMDCLCPSIPSVQSSSYTATPLSCRPQHRWRPRASLLVVSRVASYTSSRHGTTSNYPGRRAPGTGSRLLGAARSPSLVGGEEPAATKATRQGLHDPSGRSRQDGAGLHEECDPEQADVRIYGSCGGD